MTNELLNALGRFLTRDIVFILGGSSTILTVIYAFQNENSKFLKFLLAAMKPTESAASNGLFLWAIGLAWVLGYVAQESFGLLHISTPHFPPIYNGILRRLFKRLTFHDWRGDIAQPLPASRTQILAKASEQQYKELERIVTLKMVGTTIGPTCVICGLILLPKAWQGNEISDWILVVGIGILGFVLIVLGWIKLMQEAEWFHDFERSIYSTQDV